MQLVRLVSISEAYSQEEWIQAVSIAPVLVLYAIVGALEASRRPTNPIGWLFLAGASLLALGSITSGYTGSVQAAQPGEPTALFLLAAWSLNWTGNLGFGLQLIFTYHFFPDGRLPSRRWRWVAWFAVLFMGLRALTDMLLPGPLYFFPEMLKKI